MEKFGINSEAQETVQDGQILEGLEFSSQPMQKDRVTVQFVVYHEQVGEHPFEHRVVFQSPLETSEDPWRRRYKITEDWQKLDVGYLDAPGLIVLENRTGLDLQRVPTPEEKQVVEDAVIVYSIDGQEPGYMVRAGRVAFFEVQDPSRLQLRSLKGVARATITILPR